MEHPLLTPKQISILFLLYRFRFLTTHQIQILLSHKEPRRIKAWLKELYDEGYLGRIYSRKEVGANVPAIYYLNTKARSALKGQKGIHEEVLKRIYREKLRSKSFIDHSVFLADIYLYLNTLAQENKETLHFFTKTDLAQFNYLPLPLPDAYIALEVSKKDTKRYFLEIIDEGLPRFAVRKKVQRYFIYFDNNLWEKHNSESFPKVLLICPTESLKKYLHKFIAQTLEEETAEIEFYVTTKEKLRNKEKNIWEKAKLQE